MTLKQKTFSAGRWTAFSALFTSSLQVIQVAVLARLLSPADFGLMAVTASTVAVLGLFADLGLSRAIVYFENIPTDALHSLYWLNLITGTVLSICFAVSAPWLGSAFGLEGLTNVLLATSPFFLLSALGQQYCALAEKAFRFADLARKEAIAAVAGFIAAITIATSGGKVYALVGALLVSTIVGSVIAWRKLSMGYRPRLHLKLSDAHRYLRYGRYLMGESFLNTLLRQADVFVAGLFSTPLKLGLFSLPRDLNLRIGMIVNPIVTRVSFPLMSRLQEDRNALKSVYLQSLRMTASANFPIYVLLGLFSNEVIELLYGPQWKEAAGFLRLLAGWGLLRSIGNPVGSLLHAVGAVKLAFWWNVAVLILITSIYWITTRYWNLNGLALAMLFIHIALVPLMWWFLVNPICATGFSQYVSQILTPLIMSLTAGAIAWLLTLELTHGALRLTMGSAAFGVSYLGLSWAFNRRWAIAMLELLRLKKPSASN